jgi:hypothetical protein
MDTTWETEKKFGKKCDKNTKILVTREFISHLKVLLKNSATPDSGCDTNPEMQHQKPGDATPIWRCNSNLKMQNQKHTKIRKCNTKNLEMQQQKSIDATPIHNCITEKRWSSSGSADATPESLVAPPIWSFVTREHKWRTACHQYKY